MKNGKQKRQFMVCTYRCDDEDVQFGKIYAVTPAKETEKEGLLRVNDKSGEDYLYPQKYFAPVQLSTSSQAAFTSKG